VFQQLFDVSGLYTDYVVSASLVPVPRSFGPVVCKLLFPRVVLSKAKNKVRTSGLEPLTCSLRVRFVPLYLSREVAYLQGKAFAAYRRVTLNYAQVSVPVSVR
jgi:hypothetical protein